MPANVLGVQLMKLFLCDLLGRDTVEAKIFQQAVEKELPTARVVSLWAKVLSVLLVIGLNFYFIFAAILYGKDKSYEWQGIWLSTFLVNITFDITVSSTLEVLVLDYIIPLTIKGRTASIKKKLNDIIECITIESNNNISTNSNSNHNNTYTNRSIYLARGWVVLYTVYMW